MPMMLGTATPVLDSSLYIPELKARAKESVLAQIVAAAYQSGAVRGAGPLLELLRLRERLGTTALGKGVAVPHARSLTVDRPSLVVARSHRGVDWDAPDGLPANLILLVLSPGEWGEEAHQAFIARAVGVARIQRNRHRLLEAENFAEVSDVLREAHP
jgi:mannitol/fructose-specific phosphotransferase system IIA component (Ntr-type)